MKSISSGKQWICVTFDLIFMMRDIKINSKINLLTKPKPQMITKTIPNQQEKIRKLCYETGHSRLMESQWKPKQPHD